MIIQNRLMLFTILALFTTVNGYTQEHTCDKVLDLGFNIYKLYSKTQINETYNLMLTKSEVELDEMANKYEAGDSFDGSYKLIAVAWSKNRKNSSFRNKFKTSKFRYEAGLTIDNSFINYIKTKTVNEETLSKWESCRKLEINRQIMMQSAELKKGGFSQNVIGDESSIFTFIINTFDYC